MAVANIVGGAKELIETYKNSVIIYITRNTNANIDDVGEIIF